MEKNETDRLLQTCLDLIRNGHLSMEEVLALYPEHVEEFRPRLEAMLWLTQAAPLFEPRPGFVHASQRRLVERIKQESAVQTSAPVAPAASIGFFAWLSNFFGQKRFAVQFAVVMVLIIALFVSSTGVALAAQDTIPGDNLYPVKLAVENLQLAVTTSAAGEARLRTDFAKRRLLEIQSLVLEGRYQYIPSVVENFEMQVTHATDAINALALQNSNQAQELATSLENTLNQQTPVMAILAQVAPEETRLQFARVQKVAEDVLASVEGIVAHATSTPNATAGQTASILTPSATSAAGTIFTPTSGPTSGPPVVVPPVTRVVTGIPTSTAISIVPPLIVNPPTPTSPPVFAPKPSPTPTLTPTPTPEPRPTREPNPTKEPKPTREPKPTKEPKPTNDHRPDKNTPSGGSNLATTDSPPGNSNKPPKTSKK